MQYQGGKARIAKRIVSTMIKDEPDRNIWCEPFLGGGWVFDAAHASQAFNSFLLSDFQEDLILLYQAIKDGWVPPISTTKEDYDLYRYAEPSALRALIGYGSSYSGKWYRGFCGDKLNGKNTYAHIAANNMSRRFDSLQGASITYNSYENIHLTNPKNTIIYCDPPYDGTEQYKASGLESFNYNKFWDWCIDKSDQGCAVYVSEFSEPEINLGKVIWSRTAKTTMAREDNPTVTELLIRVK